ncbi:MAG: transcriptional regulator, XRE family protein [Rhizobiales bacterium 35-68-8]|nr:MAG: transcriptional regulator, XRE family protein [Rhizobiales bacterium 35-68-8]
MPEPSLATANQSRPDAGRVVGKALVRAADALRLSGRQVGEVIGVSPATVSRLRSESYRLEPGTKPFELAVLFVRLYRALDAMTGGDEGVSAAWLAAPNLALDAVPAERIRTVSGLLDVIAYLDARRARV